MWLFTTHGFYSVTTAGRRKVQIRARVRDHLERLKSAFRKQLRGPIIETPDADYRYRIIAGRDAWQKVASQLADEIDYPNFKNAVFNEFGQDNYETALHRVWAIMHGLQPRRPLPPESHGRPESYYRSPLESWYEGEA